MLTYVPLWRIPRTYKILPMIQSAKVSRILSRFHAHKLIAKIPRTRKWKVTDRGRRVMAIALRLRHAAFPELYQKAIAA